MADWKMPVNYNYNPSYHAYAYGLMYPAGPEQTPSNLSGWAEAAYHTGVNGGYYSAPPQAPQPESPPQSPEQSPEHTVIAPDNGQHFPGSILYFGDPHGRLYLSQNRTQHDGRTKAVERANSDQTSDSEAHKSPDSWSSGSSREGCVPPTHHVPWATKDNSEETNRRSPDGNAHVSSSQGPTRHVLGTEEENLTDSKPTTTPKPVKPKSRSAFSQSQMIALTHRFNIQRYLTPVEMKTLAGLTGLTYKQVKTWFQNRRMKLRRHQKDNSWVSERCTATVYSNSVPTLNQFQADPQTQDYYNQQMRKTQLNVSPTQKLPYYAGPSALPPQPTSPQTLHRPQDVSWPLPPPVTHYECLPNGYSTGHGVNNTSINSD